MKAPIVGTGDASTGQPTGINWPVVAGTGVALVGVVTLFVLAVRGAGRGASKARRSGRR